MLAHIYETLEMRVGVRLASGMSDAQLDEFESYINKNNESGALKWLETNFPNYKDVVAEELGKLKEEVKASARRSWKKFSTGRTGSHPPTLLSLSRL